MTHLAARLAVHANSVQQGVQLRRQRARLERGLAGAPSLQQSIVRGGDTQPVVELDCAARGLGRARLVPGPCLQDADIQLHMHAGQGYARHNWHCLANL